MPPHPITVRLVATLAALLILAPATVLAGSSPPSFGTPLKIIDSEPNVPSAINSSGQVITLRPGSGRGPALQLATALGSVRTEQLRTAVAGYDNPSVAIADSGAFAATWDTSSSTGASIERLEIAVGSLSALPRQATVVATGDDMTQDEQAFETSLGTAVVLWDNANASGVNSVQAEIVPGGGGVPSPVTLDADAYLVGAGIDSTGALVVIDAGKSSLIERTIAPDGVVGSPDAFRSGSLAKAVQANLSVLIDGAGDQLFYWATTGDHQMLRAQWRSASGVLGPVQSLGASGSGTDEGAPAFALNRSGSAVVVLTPYGPGPVGVRFATRLGAFGAMHRLGAAADNVDEPSVSIDGGGRTVVTWVGFPSGRGGGNHGRELAAEARGTTFDPPAPLAVQPGLGDAYLGDFPLAAASPDAAQTAVTYAGSQTSAGVRRSVGQIAFLQG